MKKTTKKSHIQHLDYGIHDYRDFSIHITTAQKQYEAWLIDSQTEAKLQLCAQYGNAVENQITLLNLIKHCLQITGLRLYVPNMYSTCHTKTSNSQFILKSVHKQTNKQINKSIYN